MATARSSVKVNDLLSLEDIWGDLNTGIEQIFGRQALPKGHFMELYSHVYNYCSSAELLRVRRIEESLMAPVARATKTKEGPQQTKGAHSVYQLRWRDASQGEG